MIVACSHCNTKFNLPDDKVRPEGVKIRCTRCKNIFEVFPPQDETAADDSFSADLGDDFAGFDDDASDDSMKETEGAAAKSGTDMDLGGDDFNLDTGDTDFNLDDDLDLGSGTGKAKGDDGSLEFDLDKEQAGAGSGGDDLDFNLDDVDTPAKSDAPPGKKPQEDYGDINLSFDDDQKSPSGASDDLDLSAFDEKPPAAKPGPIPQFDVPPAQSKTIDDDFNMGSGDIPMSSGGDISFGDSVDIGADDAFGDMGKPVSKVKSKKKAGRTSPVTVALIILLVLVGGGFYAYTTFFAGGFDADKLIALFSGKQDPLAGFENVEGKMQYYYVMNKEVGKVLVLEGSIINHAEVPKGRIKVRVTFVDKNGKEIARAEAYCGNILELAQLENLPKKEIAGLLSIPAGKKFNNALIKPNDSIPYMIVVFSVPENADGFSVAVSDAQIVGN